MVPLTIPEPQSQLLLKHRRCEKVWPPVQNRLTTLTQPWRCKFRLIYHTFPKEPPTISSPAWDKVCVPMLDIVPLSVRSDYGSVASYLKATHLPHIKTRMTTRHKQCKLLVSTEITGKGEWWKQFCFMSYGTRRHISLYSILLPSLSSLPVFGLSCPIVV